MHASAIAAGVVYWNGATLDALARRARAPRATGAAAFATIDAGPHVKVLVAAGRRRARARRDARDVPGVLRVIEARPGEGARCVDATEECVA